MMRNEIRTVRVLRTGFTYGFYVRVLRTGFTYGFYVRVLRTGFTYGFYVRVLRTGFTYGFYVPDFTDLLYLINSTRKTRLKRFKIYFY